MKATAEVAYQHEILRCLAGSGVHGMAIEGRDDRDEMGIFIEPPEVVFSRRPMDSYTWRTQPEAKRSGPGDTDLVLYSLRHWMDLATAGNPSVLILLFAQGDDILTMTPLGKQMRDARDWIISRQAGLKFLGYLDGQFERMQGGGKRKRVPNRPELIEEFGYDTKYASHAVRLGLQGIELMTTGALSLPMQPVDLDLCMQVKRGKVDYQEAVELVSVIRNRLSKLLAYDSSSPLPREPNEKAVRELVIEMHHQHWDYPL